MNTFTVIHFDLSILLAQSVYNREQHRDILLGILVVDCLGSEKLNSYNPLIHLQLIITGKEKVTSSLIHGVLIKPLGCTD